MKTLAHGKTAHVRADGSSLIRQMVLTPEQSVSLRHDLKLIKKSVATNRNLRIADIAFRAVVVLALVTVGALVFNTMINEFLALAIVVPLLFSTDAFKSVSTRIAAKHDVNLRDSKLYSTVSSMIGTHLFNKTNEQKTASYFSLLSKGEMIFSTRDSYRLLLEGGTDTPHTLSYVVG